MSTESALVLTGIRKAWDRPVLKSIDLNIDAPGVYSILGVNGAGKTTLLRIMFGLIVPDAGSVITPRRVSIVPESPGLYAFLTGREYLTLAAEFLGMRGRETRDRIDEILLFMALEGLDHKLIGHYSNGMKQKLSLAAALLADPGLLLLDEPLTGVDLNTAERVRRLVRYLADERIVVMTTHILELAHSISSAVFLLDDGVLSSPIDPREVPLEQLRADICQRLD